MTQTEMDWLAPLQITSVVQTDGSVLYHIRKQGHVPGYFISPGKGYKVMGMGCRAIERLLKKDGWVLMPTTPGGPKRWIEPLPF